jgi:glycosyltransferase involved in cell wall biosynthesis
MVSRESLEHYKARFPRFSDKFCYVSTFADDATIPLMTRDEAKKELGLLPSQVLLSYVGRLHPQKRVDETIDVFFKLVPNHPDLVLWIAGGGELEADLRAQASRLGLDEKQLRFLGVIDRATVGCLLRASDLSILLTNWEGTPMSLLESLAIGTPAVVSDVADHRRIIADGVNGYVVGRGDVEAIANVLETALNEKERLWKGAAESGQQYLGSRVVPQILGHVTS